MATSSAEEESKLVFTGLDYSCLSQLRPSGVINPVP